MRRDSDTRSGVRTGRGRRTRDRLLSGEPPAPAHVADGLSSTLDHLLYFVGDELRESALAVGGIETFLVQVEAALSEVHPSVHGVDKLLAEADLDERVASLDDALGSLVRSLERLRAALSADRDAHGAEISNQAASNA